MSNLNFVDQYHAGRDLVESGDPIKGMALLESSAQDFAEAATYLGFLFQEGESVARDTSAARRWLLRGLELGDFESAFQLGVIELEAKNLDIAFEWFKFAANSGHVPAAQRMGYLALNISLTKLHLTEALDKMAWAVEQGHVFAMRSLSKVFLSKAYGRRNIVKLFFCDGVAIST